MILNGITYHKKTDINIINAIDHAYQEKIRVRVWYGKNGKSWNEENDIIGYIGRSTGINKIPLLVYNRQSMGGGGLLDNCIVKMIDVKAGRLLYQHPKFKQAFFEADDTIVYECKKEGARHNAQIWANCESYEKAKRLADFMNGKRNSK